MSKVDHSPAHGGEHVVRALVSEGVQFVFTLCGGHISPILAAAEAAGIRVVDCRHEATAVFAADAVARLTGVPGVAAVTAGPGVTNTITALKNAQVAQSPVVVLGGAAPTVLQGRGALQDIDQRALVSPHVKLYRKVTRVVDLGLAVREGFAIALEGVRGPVFIECPVDLLYDEATVRKWYTEGAGKSNSLTSRALRLYMERHLKRMFVGRGGPERAPRVRPTAVPPARSAMESAGRALAKSKRPVLVIGSQAVTVASDVSRIAAAVAQLGIPVYLSGMARGLLGREHPLQLRHARRSALRAADCVVLAGVPCDFRLDYGRHIRRDATLIAANRSPRDARMNRRPTVFAAGDAGLFLQQLEGSISSGTSWLEWIAELRERDSAREAEIDALAGVAGELTNPIRFFRELDAIAGDNATFVADGGDFVAAASYVVRPRGPLGWLDPGAFGTLGVGSGFALGAALARGDSEVWILYGDGASGYGLVEFDTFVRHGIPVIGIVGNDASWAQIAREQAKLLHTSVGTVLRRSDYHKVVEGFGATGLLITENAQIPETLAQAKEIVRSGTPVLINLWLARTDFREGSISM